MPTSELDTINKSYIAFSGGVDSTALALLMPDAIPVFTDTGWEFPETYAHIDKFEAVTGREVIRVKQHQYPGGIPQYIRERKFMPSHGARYCTRLFKSNHSTHSSPTTQVHSTLPSAPMKNSALVISQKALSSSTRFANATLTALIALPSVLITICYHATLSTWHAEDARAVFTSVSQRYAQCAHLSPTSWMNCKHSKKTYRTHVKIFSQCFQTHL